MGDVPENGSVILKSLPSGSTLGARDFKGELFIDGDLAGDFTFRSLTRDGAAERTFMVSGDVTGSVAVGGFAAEPVNDSGAINIVSEMTELFVHQCAECDVV
jgi:hypothetical protein